MTLAYQINCNIFIFILFCFITFEATVLGARRCIDDISNDGGAAMVDDTFEKMTCAKEQMVKLFFFPPDVLLAARFKLLKHTLIFDRRGILRSGKLAWLLEKLRRQLYEQPRET